MIEKFYLQDNRSFVGNDILWWAKDGKGYTTDIDKAEIFSRDDAVRQNQCRETDIPWPKPYVDRRTRPAVDMQYVDIKEALKHTDIKLTKPEKPKKDTYRCEGCGVFMDRFQYYGAPCGRCDCDNRP